MYKTVNQRLKFIMKEKEVSQIELSKILNCKRQLVSGWINGSEAISARLQIKILEYFNDVDARWFLFGEEVDNVFAVNESSSSYNKKSEIEIRIEYLERENELLRTTLKEKDELLEMFKSGKIKSS